MNTKTRYLVPLFAILATVCAQAADVGLRLYHPHEVRNLLAEPAASYPECRKRLAVVQFPADRYPDTAKQVRNCFPASVITEEHIIGNVKDDAAEESTFNGLVKRIAAGEAAGWEWGDILVYREPLFAAIAHQNLLPGPWTDRRLISERDIRMLRARLRRAHAAGELVHADYRICGLIHSWLNIGEPEKAFIRSSLDGLYVELNTSGGKWAVDGAAGTIGAEFQNPGHNFAAFGKPGTRDCARMAEWCLKEGKRFGITHGANVPDVWFRAMFDDYLLRAREIGVDPASPRCTYLLHHNRSKDDGGLPYFPESQVNSITALAKYLLDHVATQPSH